MQNCSEDKSYIFTNTEVKYAKSNMAQATDETKIELVMTKKTIIEEFLENESEISKSQEKVVEIKRKILQKSLIFGIDLDY